MEQNTKWVVKMCHRKTGSSYYLVGLRLVSNEIKPQCCMKYHAMGRAAVFGSIADACSVVRKIDSLVWRCIIRPEGRMARAAGDQEAAE